MSQILKEILRPSFIFTMIRVFVPLMFAAMSAYVASLSGMPNIAVEGIMLMSALMAVLGSYWTRSAALGLVIALATGILMGLVVSGFTMWLGTNPILVGIALNTFASSFTIFLLYMVTGNKGTSASLASLTLPVWNIPFLKDIPVLGEILSGHYTLTYVCFACMIVVSVLVYRTPFGMRMRACGINEEAARSAGINVNRVRVISIILSGAFAALGGAYMTTGYLSSFVRNMIAGRGWVGIAAQAMGGSSFLGVTVTTIFFGVFQAIANVLSIFSLPSELVTIIPYAGVFIGLLCYSVSRYWKTRRGHADEE